MLNQIDSRHLKNSFIQTSNYYRYLFKELVDSEGSPYKGKDSLDYGEFLWALNTISARHVCFDGHDSSNDPNMLLMLVPVLDLLNHSNKENAGLFPFHDKLNDGSYIDLVAKEEIKAGDQVTVSYGKLSNIHLA